MEQDTKFGISERRLNEAREKLATECKKYRALVIDRIQASKDSLGIAVQATGEFGETDEVILKKLYRNSIRHTENFTRLIYRYATEYGLSIFDDIDRLTKNAPELQAIIQHVADLVITNGVPFEKDDLTKVSLFANIRSTFYDYKGQELDSVGKDLGSFNQANPEKFAHWLAKALVFSDESRYEHNRRVLVHFLQTTKQRWLGEEMAFPIQLLLFSVLLGTGKSTMLMGFLKFLGKYGAETTYQQLVGRFNTDFGVTKLLVVVSEATHSLVAPNVNNDNLHNTIDGRHISVERKGIDILMLKPRAAIVAALNKLPKSYRNRRNGVFYFIECKWNPKDLERIEGLIKPDEWEEVIRNLFYFCPRPEGEWDFRDIASGKSEQEDDLNEFFITCFRDVRSFLRPNQKESLAWWGKLLRKSDPEVNVEELEFWFKSTDHFVRSADRQRSLYQDWIMTPEFFELLNSQRNLAIGEFEDQEIANSPYEQLKRNIAKIPVLRTDDSSPICSSEVKGGLNDQAA